MSGKKRIGLNHQISEEAAQWLVEFRTGDIDAAGRRDFDAWVRASPVHLRAFIEMAALWNESRAIDAQRRLDIEAIVARARGERQVIALPPAATPEESIRRPCTTKKTGTAAAQQALSWKTSGRRVSRAARLATTASLLTVAAGVVLVLTLELAGATTYSTRVGERRSIRLADGSTVVLDSRSSIRVEFTAAIRDVQLLQGQALFHVAKNPRRPFLVRAGDTAVRDVGTQFDVDRSADGTVVTVLEGQVSVTAAAVASPAVADEGTLKRGRPAREGIEGAAGRGPADVEPILLSAGEQLDVVPENFSARPVHVNISTVTAWMDGKVVLESVTLAQVAEVFNRYSTRKLVAHDHGVQPLHLSGVFATNPDFLIRYLRGRPDIVITETDSEIDIVRNTVQ